MSSKSHLWFALLAAVAAGPLRGEDTPEEEKSGESAWLGVRCEEVPQPLASQLELESGAGALIVDVVDDGPADEAGIERWDIVVEAGGEKISGGADSLPERIAKMAVGDELPLVVLRRGEKKELTATLGKRESRFEFKHGGDAGVFYDSFGLREGWLKRGENGPTFQWEPGGTFKLDFEGKLGAGLQPFDYLVHGDKEDVRFEASGDGVRMVRKLRRSDDGTELEIEERKSWKSAPEDHSIIVTRTKSGEGDESSEKAEYRSAEELEEKDPEAFKLYSEKQGAPGWQVWNLSRGKDGGRLFHAPLGKELDADVLRQHLERFVDGAKLEAGKLGEILSKDVLEKWEPGDIVRQVIAGKELDRQFQVDEEGRVRVTIRKGKKSLELSFSSLEELEKKRPDLFEEYLELSK